MPHNMTIPDEMWEWACEQGAVSGEGPASFLRGVLIGAMRPRLNNNNNKPQREERKQEEPRTYSNSGVGIHEKCYEAMVADHQGPIPRATPWDATRNTICPECHKFIHAGELIVMTSWEEWGRS
jgi:hypothetical protein